MDCQECGKPLTKVRVTKNPRYSQKFCSAKCRMAAYDKANPRIRKYLQSQNDVVSLNPYLARPEET